MKNEKFGKARVCPISIDEIAAVSLYSMEMHGSVNFYALLNSILRLADRNAIKPFVMLCTFGY